MKVFLKQRLYKIRTGLLSRCSNISSNNNKCKWLSSNYRCKIFKLVLNCLKLVPMPMLVWVDSQGSRYGLTAETAGPAGDPKAETMPVDGTLQIAAQNHAGYLQAAAAASVAPVLVAGAPAAAAKSSSTFGGTVAKGLGAALGLGAIALGAYSLTKGIPVARAADMAYAKTRSVASREIRRLR